jgi:hypothetical protein
MNPTFSLPFSFPIPYIVARYIEAYIYLRLTPPLMNNTITPTNNQSYFVPFMPI